VPKGARLTIEFRNIAGREYAAAPITGPAHFVG
jgi:hypothetical protein